MKRRLTVGNVGTALAEYSEAIASVGGKIQGKLGLKLLHEVKREPTGTGPYPNVTLFEAANRIMTDLVILKRREVAAGEIWLPFLRVPRRVRK